MPPNVERFLADTSNLTPSEGWAYINIICHMWRSHDGTLSNDEIHLARSARVYRPRWNRIWTGIKHLFDVDGERVTCTNLQAELGRANAKTVIRQAMGRLGGLATAVPTAST